MSNMVNIIKAKQIFKSNYTYQLHVIGDELIYDKVVIGYLMKDIKFKNFNWDTGIHRIFLDHDTIISEKLLDKVTSNFCFYEGKVFFVLKDNQSQVYNLNRDTLETKAMEDFKPFLNITQTFDEKNKKVTICWECLDKNDIMTVLIYRGESKEKMSKHIYVASPNTSFNEAYDPKYNVYRIRPFYKSRMDQHVSDYIVLLSSIEKK